MERGWRVTCNGRWVAPWWCPGDLLPDTLEWAVAVDDAFESYLFECAMGDGYVALLDAP
jgi:hypothetical protein